MGALSYTILSDVQRAMCIDSDVHIKLGSDVFAWSPKPGRRRPFSKFGIYNVWLIRRYDGKVYRIEDDEVLNGESDDYSYLTCDQFERFFTMLEG